VLSIRWADPTVRFLKERMEKAGCKVYPSLIQAANCSSAGGYASGQGVRCSLLLTV
jgi:inner membrane protease ATP23